MASQVIPAAGLAHSPIIDEAPSLLPPRPAVLPMAGPALIFPPPPPLSALLSSPSPPGGVFVPTIDLNRICLSLSKPPTVASCNGAINLPCRENIAPDVRANPKTDEDLLPILASSTPPARATPPTAGLLSISNPKMKNSDCTVAGGALDANLDNDERHCDKRGDHGGNALLMTLCRAMLSAACTDDQNKVALANQLRPLTRHNEALQEKYDLLETKFRTSVSNFAVLVAQADAKDKAIGTIHGMCRDLQTRLEVATSEIKTSRECMETSNKMNADAQMQVALARQENEQLRRLVEELKKNQATPPSAICSTSSLLLPAPPPVRLLEFCGNTPAACALPSTVTAPPPTVIVLFPIPVITSSVASGSCYRSGNGESKEDRKEFVELADMSKVPVMTSATTFSPASSASSSMAAAASALVPATSYQVALTKSARKIMVNDTVVRLPTGYSIVETERLDDYLTLLTTTTTRWKYTDLKYTHFNTKRSTSTHIVSMTSHIIPFPSYDLYRINTASYSI
jgi:hypothetical protein